MADSKGENLAASPSLTVALYEPEIPPNTGNIIRLCANSGSRLALIHPLGFMMDDKRLRRAGLDYHQLAHVNQYPDYNTFIKASPFERIFACSTKGTRDYDDVRYEPGDCLLFGPESRGLPQTVLETLPTKHMLRLPMIPGSRSLNLSNAVAIFLYEAWRQLGFSGAATNKRV